MISATSSATAASHRSAGGAFFLPVELFYDSLEACFYSGFGRFCRESRNTGRLSYPLRFDKTTRLARESFRGDLPSIDFEDCFLQVTVGGGSVWRRCWCCCSGSWGGDLSEGASGCWDVCVFGDRDGVDGGGFG